MFNTFINITLLIIFQERLEPLDQFNIYKHDYYFVLLLFFAYSLFLLLKIHLCNGKISFKMNVFYNPKEIHYLQNYYPYVYALIFISSLLIFLHAFNGGLEKLYLLGSDISGKEFRFTGSVNRSCF